MSPVATPVAILESFFDVPLERSSLKRFDEVSNDEWRAFATHYQSIMKAEFAPQFLAAPEPDDASFRLYFEPGTPGEWEAAVERLHAPTPLLGKRADPGDTTDLTRDDVSRMLAPLAKHLLIADSVYIRDSFYYCFDWMIEHPGDPRTVESNIRELKAWLPILVELRDLIESKALVFMPYYVTPSFPYLGDSPKLRPYLGKIGGQFGPVPGVSEADGKAVPDIARALAAAEAFDPVERQSFDTFSPHRVLGAWLNARILHLDPVFPTRAMFDYAADLRFEDGPGTTDVTSDLMSIEVLPFGRDRVVGVDELSSIRRNEEAFHLLRSAVLSCKDYLEENGAAGDTRAIVTDAVEQLLREKLELDEGKSIFKFIDEKPIGGVVFSIALGVALLPVSPAIGVVTGALVTPQLLRLLQRKIDPKHRARSQLQALL